MANSSSDAAGITIPPEFQSELRVREATDQRSDADIFQSMAQYRAPQSSEKNIWAFWHSGIHSMPPWCKRNVINWARLNPGWTVRVLDSVPESPNNALKYLPAHMLPESFVEGTMEGPYTGPHSADFLRGACLYLFGGVYMDVGIILIRDLDRICWNKLTDKRSPFKVAVPWMYGTTMANHFVASRKDDPFIKRWHELFVHLWAGHTSHEGIIDTPLMAPLQDGMSFDNSRASNFHWDFKVDAHTVMNYIGQVLAWQRLCMLEATDEDDFSGVDYWTEHVLIWDVLSENWGMEATIGFKGSGERAFELLALKRDEATKAAHPEEWNAAYDLVWRLLTKSSMQKITHGKGLTTSVHLGVLWDLPENRGKDSEPGTFAELLRYGTVNLEQTREEIAYQQAPRPSKTIKKGLLEA